jgi:hypothetical protein
MEKRVCLGCLNNLKTPSLSAAVSFIFPAAASTTALSIVSTNGVTAPEAMIAEPTAI